MKKNTSRVEMLKRSVAADFGVQQVAVDKDWVLFAAEHKDFFHLVELDTKSAGISQHHIPHLALARAIEKAAEGRTQLTMNGTSYVAPATGAISVASGFASGEMLLVICNEDAVPFSVLDAGLGERFLRTTGVLAAARKKVILDEGTGHYELPGAKTHDGNPVSSLSKDLMDGIAFERSLRRRLNARDFGLYSAFCSHMDFPCALHSKSCIREFVDQIREWPSPSSPEWHTNGFRDLALEVQEKLFPFPIWAPSVAQFDSARAADGLEKAIAKLSPAQATQVVLLNGMHGADIFLALATVTGIRTFEHYQRFVTADTPIGSEPEQFIRISASFIELFGAIAPPCPGYRRQSNKKKNGKKRDRNEPRPDTA